MIHLRAGLSHIGSVNLYGVVVRSAFLERDDGVLNPAQIHKFRLVLVQKIRCLSDGLFPGLRRFSLFRTRGHRLVFCLACGICLAAARLAACGAGGAFRRGCAAGTAFPAL